MEKKVKKIKKASSKKTMTQKEREQILTENFVGLQKAMMNLSVKFETLSENIERLLHIFELSAKDYLKNSEKESDKDLLKKLDSLIEQNKTIARGLVLIDEKVRHKPHMIESTKPNLPLKSPPIQKPQPPKHRPLPQI